ncbi:MAG: helix-turn-helix transcriptional regulator [Clostridia bacterium]|nr:helix-turn-helix transcriptional regulator [Clostridia bacterium]
MGRTYTDTENEYFKKIGEKLRLYRNNKHLTQKEVATDLNIKPDDISKYENGKEAIGLISLKKLCDYYGTNISAFLYNVEKPLNNDKNKIIDEIEKLKRLSTNFSITANNIIKNLEDIK